MRFHTFEWFQDGAIPYKGLNFLQIFNPRVNPAVMCVPWWVCLFTVAPKFPSVENSLSLTCRKHIFHSLLRPIQPNKFHITHFRSHLELSMGLLLVMASNQGPYPACKDLNTKFVKEWKTSTTLQRLFHCVIWSAIKSNWHKKSNCKSETSLY